MEEGNGSQEGPEISMGIDEKVKKHRNFFKRAGKWFLEHPVRNTLLTGLSALVLTSALKDNVHCGGVRLNDMQGNHYVFGLLPITKVHGENCEGSVRTFGLLAFNDLEANSSLEGNMSVYALAGQNALKLGSTINGNMSAGGVIAGVNQLEANSVANGNMFACALFGAGNEIKYASTVNGNMTAYALFSINELTDGARIKNGDIVSRGLFVQSPRGYHFLNYVERRVNIPAISEEKSDD